MKTDLLETYLTGTRPIPPYRSEERQRLRLALWDEKEELMTIIETLLEADEEVNAPEVARADKRLRIVNDCLCQI